MPKAISLPVVGEPKITPALVAAFDQPMADEAPLKTKLTAAEVERMGPRDGSGQSYLEFQDALRRLRLEEDEQTTRNAQREASLRETERIETQRHFSQTHCPHILTTGDVAVGGQFDAHNVFQGICQSCNKVFVGIGEGPENLPVSIWGRIKPGVVGGVSLS